MTDLGASGESNRRTHRRRNRGGRTATARGSAPGSPTAPAKATPPPPSVAPEPTTNRRQARRGEARVTGSPRAPRADQGERGLRDLVGAGPSQLGPIRAMRARDVNRPHEADEAAAERDLVIVRRHWQPKDDPRKS